MEIETIKMMMMMIRPIVPENTVKYSIT